METREERVLAFLRDEMGEAERRAFEEELAGSAALRAELGRCRELLDVLEAASERAVGQRVEGMIEAALAQGASDLHLVPGPDETVVFLRIDGALRELERLPRELHQAVVDRWKTACDASVMERRRPQEGRLRVTREETTVDLRVGILPTVFGERVTVRFLRGTNYPLGLAALGIEGETLATLRRLTGRPRGFIAVTGPLSSGKTTLAYSLLLDIQAAQGPIANLMTVEDPVEMALPGLSQTSVDRGVGLTFAGMLQALFRRSDPDVIFLGELPDRETAEGALAAAATGHLVIATLNGYQPWSVLRRFRELEVDPLFLADNLIGLTGQRLAVRNCPECLVEDHPAAADLQALGLGEPDGPFRRGAGCAACNQGGLRRRVGLYEVLEVDDALRERVAAGVSEEVLWQETFGRGSGSLREEARRLVREGILSAAEARRALFGYPAS